LLGSGFAPSKEAAIAAALGVAGPDAGKGPTGFATQHLRQTNHRKRLERGSTSTEAQPQRFVYDCHMSVDDYDSHPYEVVHPHRIVKVTTTRYYVDEEPDATRRRMRADYPVRTFVLDRTTLERAGHARRRKRWYGDYYLDPEQWRAELRQWRTGGYQTTAAACLQALGLDGRATVRDVKRAYRVKAKDVHPDRGGDPEAFKALQQHYERALQLAATGG
jgi:hypothetical protein